MGKKHKQNRTHNAKIETAQSPEDNLRQKLKKLFKDEEIRGPTVVKNSQQHTAKKLHQRTLFNGGQKQQSSTWNGDVYQKPVNGSTLKQTKAQTPRKANWNGNVGSKPNAGNAAQAKNIKTNDKGKPDSTVKTNSHGDKSSKALEERVSNGLMHQKAADKEPQQLKRTATGKGTSSPQKKKLKTAVESMELYRDSESESGSESELDSSDTDDLVERLKNEGSDSSSADLDASSDDEEYDSGEEEDIESYSDYDEEDYEEEEQSDSLDYEEEDYSDSDVSSVCYNFECASNDEDYKLPENVPEDLIIHQGTAETRTLLTEDEVKFDSDNEEAQIVELTTQYTAKTVLQPNGYERTELLKLNDKVEYHKRLKAVTIDVSERTDSNTDSRSNASDCPELVPIVDDDGFELYNPVSDSSDQIDTDDSLSSDYEMCSDDSSIVETDINSKYLEEQDSDDEDLPTQKAPKMRADVIDAQNCEYEPEASVNSIDDEDQAPEELPSERLEKHASSVEGVDGVVSIPIMDAGDDLPELELISNAEDVSTNEELTSAELETTPAYIPVDLQNTQTVLSTPAAPSQSFRTLFYNAIDANHVLVLLKDPFYVYGTIRLTLLAGAVEVYGHQPRVGDELEIFSPRGCSSVQIAATTQSESERTPLSATLKTVESNFSHVDLQSVTEQYTRGVDAIVLLRRNTERRKLINTFKKYMNENVFPNMNAIQNDRPLYASEYMLRCFINTASEKALQVPPQWATLSLTKETRLMLVGGKAVGKSTLLRYLLNRHLRQHDRVLLIDLDIGQAEVFVPQTISCTVVSQPLLGPGFFLNQQPAKAYMIGQTNIVLCAHAYMRAVKQLLHHCQSQPEYAQLPWLINTMGYNKGFGLELLAVVCDFLRPTDIVQLQSKREVANFDVLLDPQLLETLPRNIYTGDEFRASHDTPLQHRLRVLNAAVPQESRYQREWDMSPKDLRYATVLARLSDALQGNAEWLSDCKPLSAPLNSLKVLKMPAARATREELLNSIEANLVYLCHCSENEGESVECFGIGVVRGIDYHLQQVYLLPAMPYRGLRSVNCLALGEMPLPTSLLTNQGPKVKYVAPFVYNTVDAKASKSIKQIYHRPPEFVGGKHKNLTDT